MRILFLTNFYPPYARGGEEYSCQQAAEGLRRRGHEIYVLTSTHGTGNGLVEEETISRSLFLEMELLPWRNSLMLLTRRKAREAHNLQRFRQVFDTFRPDLVFVWGMWNLQHSLPQLAEELCPERVVYRFATYWPTLPSQYTEYWLAPGRTRVTRILRRLIRPLALAFAPHDENNPPIQFRHMICVSEAVKEQLLTKGIDASQARVIYTGLDTLQYGHGGGSNGSQPGGSRLRLLYSGRLAADKGVHTLIQAMHDLVNRPMLVGQISLTLAGSGDVEYESKLHAMVSQLALSEHITFLGQIPYAEMSALYSDYDVLVVPSIWPEPFARTVLEGMASGLAVVATAEGGTGEILRDGHNGLLFRAGDASDLANRIVMLYEEPGKRDALAAAARQTISRDFGEQHMLDQMESCLVGIVNWS